MAADFSLLPSMVFLYARYSDGKALIVLFEKGGCSDTDFIPLGLKSSAARYSPPLFFRGGKAILSLYGRAPLSPFPGNRSRLPPSDPRPDVAVVGVVVVERPVRVDVAHIVRVRGVTKYPLHARQIARPCQCRTFAI